MVRKLGSTQHNLGEVVGIVVTPHPKEHLNNFGIIPIIGMFVKN